MVCRSLILATIYIVATVTASTDQEKREHLRKDYDVFKKDWNEMNGEALFWNKVQMPELPPEPHVGPPEMIKLYSEEGNGKMASQVDSYDSGSCEMKDVTIDPSGYDGYVPVAISKKKFFDGVSCGMCIQIKYGNFKYIGLVKDYCQHCEPQAGTPRSMNVGLKLDSGYHQMRWKAIPCPTTNLKLQYRFTQTGTSWNQIQIINNVYPIAFIRYKHSGKWVRSDHTGTSALFKMRWFQGQGSVEIVDVNGSVFNVKTQGVKLTFTDFIQDE